MRHRGFRPALVNSVYVYVLIDMVCGQNGYLLWPIWSGPIWFVADMNVITTYRQTHTVTRTNSSFAQKFCSF